ncbi:SKI/DACH domain-containing protein 1 [Hemiscyllium ocellatum]|uniref:SKI/DACH domain-containing protein 1 n=1 Tax=Hemiscyllium ocellatum TaxID=170820 RepID=UPI002966305C|nr:SKI/DACH domain-containing protein 1 [Hemiscyllium ocellatum]XP_060680977.1 SKI/DACH domain-containing protein 1 [Hemiscyllium ocellatum]
MRNVEFRSRCFCPANVGQNSGSEMGDLESGYEEVDGVRLGYLIIKGKQMFALSQVFTNLLKNIPRTTVHKRMDHLNVKKHHCDLEELRKLKAINSIAFHAAKCTLISREDVEALYTSCKTERVLKTKRRKINGTLLSTELNQEKTPTDRCASILKENKVWLTLNGTPQPLAGMNRALRGDGSSLPASNLPQFYSKFTSHSYTEMIRSHCKIPQNYETAEISSNCVAFHTNHSLFRSMICRHPVFYQSAIAYYPKSPNATGLTYYFRRKSSCEITQKHLGSSSTAKRVLLAAAAPKSCKAKGDSECLNTFHVANGQQCNQGPSQESCSSDSESSSFSGRADNDSDFGSSLSSSSNSASSDEEDDSVSDSSDVTSASDEDTSSESDSSSVSSQVSVQSIRFRRTSFSSICSKPLVLTQPSFHYQFQAKSNNVVYETASTDLLEGRTSHCNLKSATIVKRNEQNWTIKAHNVCCSTGYGSCLAEINNDRISEFAFPHSEISHYLKRTESTINCAKEGGPAPTNPKGNTEFPQQRTLTESNKCLGASIAHCAEENKVTIVSEPADNDSSLAANAEIEPNTGNFIALSSTFQSVNTDRSQGPAVRIHSDNAHMGKAVMHNITVKLEENSCDEEYEYVPQQPRKKLKYACNVSKRAEATLRENKIRDCFSTKAKESHVCTETATSSQNASRPREDLQRTLNIPVLEDCEFRNGARIRRNYRTLVLGKQHTLQNSSVKTIVKSENPRLTGKTDVHEGTLEEFAGSNKRKRIANGVASTVKRPFNFMANFPSPPSLIIGNDGDLCPAYSLNSTKDPEAPQKAHPVWKWQMGGAVIPLPPSHKFRRFNL